MCTDKNCGTKNKYRNIKDQNFKFPTSNDMSLHFKPFSINHLVVQLPCTFFFMQFYQQNGRLPKCGVDFASFLQMVLLKKTVWPSCHCFGRTSCHTPSETRSNMETVDMIFEMIKRWTLDFLSSYIYTISKM